LLQSWPVGQTEQNESDFNVMLKILASTADYRPQSTFKTAGQKSTLSAVALQELEESLGLATPACGKT